MSYTAKALWQQFRICERIAETPEERADVEFWRGWIKAGEAEVQRRVPAEPMAANFATAKAPEATEGKP